MRLVIVLLLCALVPSDLSSQSRPRIGLALGGGAARGIAHVGVLEWLEENRVPVDFVAGTSMGGLVGGVYAIGMSGAEARALLASIDWDRLFLGDTPYRLKSFRRKEDRRELPMKVELGLKRGVSLPGGLDPGHQVGLLMSRLALPYSRIESFDDLPTPLRLVATDMEAARAISLDHGSLAEALLATMAIPALFPPVEREGLLLSDGGLVSNVPADVVRAMGADVVIAVDVSAVRTPGGLDSALGAASQAVDVMMAENTRRALEDADLVIRPDLEGFGSLDWRRSDDIADRGRLAAEAVASELEPYRVSERVWREREAERESRTKRSGLAPEFVEVEGGGDRYGPEIVERLTPFVGEPLDLDALELELTKITGAHRFDSLRYESIRDEREEGLLVTAKPKGHGPPFLRFASELSNSRGDVDFNFGARLAALDVLKPKAELRLQGDLGSRIGVLGEYYWPFLRDALFVAPFAFYRRDTVNEFDDESLIATRRERRTGGGIDVGLRSFTIAELRAGYQIRNVSSEIRVGDPALPEPSGKESLFRMRLGIDAVDAPLIPTRGLRGEASVEWFDSAPGAPASFGRARIELAGFVPRANGDTLFLIGRGGFGFAQPLPILYRFTLGGPFELSAYRPDTFRSENLLYGSAGYLKTVGRLPDVLGGPIYAVFLFESGSVFDELDAATFRFSTGGGFVMDSALGPVSAVLSGGSGGNVQFYVSVGRLFSRRR